VKRVFYLFLLPTLACGTRAIEENEPAEISAAQQWLCEASDISVDCTAPMPGRPDEAMAYACGAGETRAECPPPSVVARTEGLTPLLTRYNMTEGFDALPWACLLTGSHQRQCHRMVERADQLAPMTSDELLLADLRSAQRANLSSRGLEEAAGTQEKPQPVESKEEVSNPVQPPNPPQGEEGTPPKPEEPKPEPLPEPKPEPLPEPKPEPLPEPKPEEPKPEPLPEPKPEEPKPCAPKPPTSCLPIHWEPYFAEMASCKYQKHGVNIVFPREIFDTQASFIKLAIEWAGVASKATPSCNDAEGEMRATAWFDAVMQGCLNLNNPILVMCQQAAIHAPKTGACKATGAW
jgi:hypothetical protein